MQVSASVSKLRQRLSQFDWSLVKGSALMSIGSFGARLLAMVFWLFVASAFSPDDYGSIQYIITLGALFAIVTHPFGQHVLARYIGKYRQEPDQLQLYLSNAWLFLGVLISASLLIGGPILWALGRLDMGVFSVFFGVTLFYTYWGVSSGYLASGRLTIAFFGSNLMQLLFTFVAIQLLNIRSVQVMLVIYGFSYLLPIIALQIFTPLPLHLSRIKPDRAALTDLFQFFWPAWISHAGYMIYIAVPILLLEYFVDNTSVGIYSLTLTLTAVFGIVNTSVATLFMPRAAELAPQERRRQLRNIMGILLMLNLVMMIGYVLTIGWFVQTFFSAEYLTSFWTYIVMGLNAVVVGMQGIVSASLLGGGQVRLDAVGRVATVILMVVFGLLLIPSLAELGAAIAALVGPVVALLIYGGAALAARRQRILDNVEE
jgi:O-antigen/teichoic acid export membrane protein